MVSPQIYLNFQAGQNLMELLKNKEMPLGIQEASSLIKIVGVRGFEPPTTRPPDVYANRTALHPDNLLEAPGTKPGCKYTPMQERRKATDLAIRSKRLTADISFLMAILR